MYGTQRGIHDSLTNHSAKSNNPAVSYSHVGREHWTCCNSTFAVHPVTHGLTSELTAGAQRLNVNAFSKNLQKTRTFGYLS